MSGDSEEFEYRIMYGATGTELRYEPDASRMRAWCDDVSVSHEEGLRLNRERGAYEITNGKVAAHGRKYMSSLHGHYKWTITKFAESDRWKEREEVRLANGTYLQVPWHDESWYEPKRGEHFCHLSVDEPGKIAFTSSPANGIADVQTRMAPGRYLKRFFNDELSAADIEYWANEVSLAAGALKVTITQDRGEIRQVFENGPSSCMGHPASNFGTYCSTEKRNIHPAEVYAGPDLGVAYAGTLDEPSGRCVVWPAEKRFSTIYGDCHRLRRLLEDKGYKSDTMRGAKFRRIECDNGIVMPYIDCGVGASDMGDHLILDNGDIPVQSTAGYVSSFRCDHCEEHVRDEDTYSVDGEVWCESCVNSDARYCNYYSEYVVEDSGHNVHQLRYGSLREGNWYSQRAFDNGNVDAVWVEREEKWVRSSDTFVCEIDDEAYLVTEMADVDGHLIRHEYEDEARACLAIAEIAVTTKEHVIPTDVDHAYKALVLEALAA